MNECKYCNDNNGWHPMIEKEGKLFDKRSNFYTFIFGDGHMSIGLDINSETIFDITHKINFCPMCGRKLKEVE